MLHTVLSVISGLALAMAFAAGGRVAAEARPRWVLGVGVVAGGAAAAILTVATSRHAPVAHPMPRQFVGARPLLRPPLHVRPFQSLPRHSVGLVRLREEGSVIALPGTGADFGAVTVAGEALPDGVS